MDLIYNKIRLQGIFINPKYEWARRKQDNYSPGLSQPLNK